MKKIIRLSVLSLILLFSLFVNGDVEYEKYFTGDSLRIDYYHWGDSKKEDFSIDKIYIEKIWSGNRNSMISNFKQGKYRYEIFDKKDGELLFSKGFDTYFGEYSTTDAAMKGIKRIYHETAKVPYPKRKIVFKIKKKISTKKYLTLFSMNIDPEDIHISNETRHENVKIYKRGAGEKPEVSLDIAIIGEGYLNSEEKKFKEDLNRSVSIFFSQSPYSRYRDKINFYGLFKPSVESGTDEPRQRIYRNSLLETTFNSLDSPRYLLTEANRKMRDIASVVPYDVILIMVNSKRYGGGGIYNLYCTYTADNQQTPYLILHEFGHSFAGLADEYYSSSVSYNDFYPQGTEPDEPNITALLNKDSLKWRNLVSNETSLPTKWKKKKFDAMNEEFSTKRAVINRKIEKLIRENSSLDTIDEAREELNKLINEKEKKDNTFFKESKVNEIVGAFEGAGYSSKGLFRPMVNCIMFTIGKKPYCKVCEKAVEKMILFYTK